MIGTGRIIMEQLDNIAGMLDLMVRPAFCVKDGAIVGCNHGARSCLIDIGTPIRNLLHTGLEEYSDFSDGCLYLTLNVHGQYMGASVTSQSGFHIFILEQDSDQAELSAMALAAQELREPLSSVMTVADRLFPMVCEDAAYQDQISRINRGLYQILRTVSNMSDAARYQGEIQGLPEVRNVTAVLDEIFQASRDLIGQAGITLRFSNLSQPLYMLLDEEKLERAIHNILSNAMKFTPKGGSIDATATIRNSKLYLTVQDSGEGIDPSLRSAVHSRYLRQPGLEDGRFGIGLGMVLIRAAASVHGGTVLMEHPEQGGVRITMSLSIQQDTNGSVRSPILKVDYSGERNHALIELSDALPTELYK